MSITRESIKDAILKQAAAVKSNSNTEKAIKLMQEAFKLIAAPEKKAAFDLQQNAQEKDIRRNRFADAIAKGKQQDKAKLLSDAHNDLTADGWKSIVRNPQTGTASYKHDSLPGHELKVDGDGTFSVTKGAELVVPKTHLKTLKATLKKIKPL